MLTAFEATKGENLMTFKIYNQKLKILTTPRPVFFRLPQPTILAAIHHNSLKSVVIVPNTSDRSTTGAYSFKLVVIVPNISDRSITRQNGLSSYYPLLRKHQIHLISSSARKRRHFAIRHPLRPSWQPTTNLQPSNPIRTRKLLPGRPTS